jgi:hypothetical protein
MLDDLKLNYKMLLDGSIIIFGESDTGKSTIIKDMSFLLKPHIDQILIISSSDKKNKSYSAYMAPKPCIHAKITGKLLDEMWQRQEALGNIYVRANNPEVLRRLFNRVATSHAQEIVASIERRRAECVANLEDCEIGDISAKVKEVNSDAEEFTNKIYKHFIGNNLDAFKGVNLSKDERLTLQYLNLNPRLLLIFDDCTTDLEKFKKHPVIQELFYQGRWSYITLIIGAHTDKSLPPELKNNAFVKIFTQDIAARSYYLRQSTALDKDKRNEYVAAINEAFTPAKKFQKLAYVRKTGKLYKYTAEIRPKFRFGAPIIWKFCDYISSDDDTIVNNKYMSKFEA